MGWVALCCDGDFPFSATTKVFTWTTVGYITEKSAPATGRDSTNYGVFIITAFDSIELNPETR